MKHLILISTLFLSVHSFSQSEKENPEVKKRINQEIEREVVQLKEQLQKENENEVHIEFAIDTFRVEKYFSKLLELNESDFWMKETSYKVAKLYDSLMNKYYKKLLLVLISDDKKVLQQAQRAWLVFRDNESSLVELLSKNEYAGGGTIQGLTESSQYLDMIKQRTIALFEHFIRATKNE